MRILFLCLLISGCQTLGITDKPSPSEQVLEILSTAPELDGNCILLCIDKDCVAIDRRKLEKGPACEVPRKTRIPKGRQRLSFAR